MKSKLFWQELVSLYLWHAYPREAFTSDDTAYAIALHIRDFCDDVLRTIAVDADTDSQSEE